MDVRLSDLLENPSLLDKRSEQQKCCEKECLEPGELGTPDGLACAGCYYEKLGNMIEQNPIASAGIRRP